MTTKATTLRALADRVEGNPPRLSQKHDIRGKRFGRLTVIRYVKSENQRRIWECLCDCGEIVQTNANKLRNKHRVSCGCAFLDRNERVFTKHGNACASGDSREYSSWRDMRRRCNDTKRKDYKYYGALGVKVCERWSKFENFLNDMGRCPPGFSIDRINPFGNYEPGNCRWADRKTQMNNKRQHAIAATKETSDAD